MRICGNMDRAENLVDRDSFFQNKLESLQQMLQKLGTQKVGVIDVQ